MNEPQMVNHKATGIEVTDAHPLGEAAGSPYPFQCTNCGHKPTPQEVLDHKGDCAKCRDTVIAYTVDAAECILRLMANDGTQRRASDARSLK